MLRKRISDPWVCNSMAPLDTNGWPASKKLSSVWPSTVCLPLNQIHTREPIILMRKVFHEPTGLSALTSGHLPGLSARLFHSAPDPLGAPFFTSRGLSTSQICTRSEEHTSELQS